MWIGMISPVIDDLDNDGYKELVVITQEDPSSKLYIIRHNGQIIANITTNCNINVERLFPSIINIYGDLKKEIVVPCANITDKKMLILNYQGNIIQEINVGLGAGGGGVYNAVVLNDINKDNSIEMIYGGWNVSGSWLVMLNNQGNTLPGFPVHLENTQMSEVNTPAIGDIGNDSYKEIVVVSHDNNPATPPLTNIRVYKVNGDLLWSNHVDAIVENSPVIGDINNDGYNEIAFTSNRGVYILDRNGDYLLELLLSQNDLLNSQIALADLDNDNDLELIFEYDHTVYAMHHSGIQLFSYETDWAIHPPVVGDINGDGNLDIIFNSDNDVYALDSLGNLLPDFPIPLPSIWYSSPSIGEIDNDGKIELITSASSSSTGTIHVFEIPNIYNTSVKMEWPMFQHDPQHTGLYLDYSVQSPQYILTANPTSGNAPLTVLFLVEGDFIVGTQFVWYFGDTTQITTTSQVQHTYHVGNYNARVRILQPGMNPVYSNYVAINVNPAIQPVNQSINELT